ncbi:MAG: hypothetical protein WKG32_00375 [Gemmatimonadaceae bacterium]
MVPWIIAVALGVVAAAILYGWRERGRTARYGSLAALGALRATAFVLLFALLLDAPAGRRRAPAPIIALDASASWLRGGGDVPWRAARERARRLASDSLWLFGDSLRAVGAPDMPSDAASRGTPLAERALASGRPVVVITDGELEDAAALRELPSGSRVEVTDRPPQRDLAVLSLEAPRSVVSADTIEVAITVRAGSAGSRPGSLTVAVAGRAAATIPLDSLAPRAERRQSVRLAVVAAEGPTSLAAVVVAPDDTERRNDTLAVALDVRRAAGAVLVSTSPDFDSRFIVPVLRGAVALPTRAYLRIAPGMWRVDGTLAAVSEAEVRRAVREAPLAIFHGDTAIFGSPRSATTGALALIAPPSDSTGEWYPVAAPASPIAAALAGIAWDSLPPLEARPSQARGDWEGLAAARAREPDHQPVIAGSERPRRVVTIAASGFWRWQFRGGASADAFAALWGSIFDWLSAERMDARAAFPAEGVVRAGDRIRWRRGAGSAAAAESTVVVTLKRRGAPASVDTISLRFPGAANVADSDPMPTGVYDVGVPGGPALLVVAASRELLPQSATVRSGSVGGAARQGDQPRLRDRGWPYVVMLLALCIEWLARRRLGLR